MLRAAVVALFILAWSEKAEANRARVDAIATFGGEIEEESRDFVLNTLREAGFAPRLQLDSEDPCGRVASCHVQRGKRDGAAMSLHVVVVRAAGRYSVSIFGVDVASGQSASQQADLDSLGAVDEALAASLRFSFFAEPASEPAPSSWVPWSLAGSSVLLGLGGTWSYLHARSLRREFFDAHVNQDGEIYGISPETARVRELTAQRWALAGGLLGAAAAISGVSATVLFVRDGRQERPRPAGISLSGTF